MKLMTKLLARNDDANPEIVLPFVFLTILLSFVFTGTAIVLAAQGGHDVALPVFSVLAALGWTILAILTKKYSRIS